jgi:ankyrin repeat protein
MITSKKNRSSAFARAIMENKNLINSVRNEDDNMLGLLHVAVRKGRLDYVRILLINAADVNLKDESKFTPLHYVVLTSNASTIKIIEMLCKFLSES